MIKMCMVNNFMKISVVLLLFMGWCGQVLGARNKFLGANETNVDHELAPADAPSLGLGCPTHGLCKVVKDLNYKCEEHNVTTKDGFILSVQKIPSTKNSSTPSQQVVLQHGVFGDGANWIVTGQESLAFILADSGFDVWLFNGRGTQYSRRHKTLHPLEFEYWDWSWDDMAKLDVTAEIEYVAKHSGQKVHYVGHSMGTLMMISLLAERAPVTKNLKSASLLSPIAHLNHITCQFGKAAASIFLADVSYWLGIGRFNLAEKPVTDFTRLVCSFNGVDCSNVLDVLTGVNCCIDTKTVNRYLTHEPQPTSVKTLVHFSQNVRDGVVKRFDYGNDEENKIHYNGSPKPPVYDLTNISPSFPLYLAYGGADTLSDVVDVLFLIKDLKNHQRDKLVTNFTFNYAHMDYLLAYDVREKVYDPMMKFMKTFSN